jgi:hypothetical protein
MRDKAGVDAATLAKNWGIGIEAAKRKRLVTTQRWIRIMIHPSLTKRYKTNDRQLRYRRLPVTMYTDTMYSTILSRQDNKEAQIFCTDFGFVREFPMKRESEAHEALSLLFHRYEVPNVMVVDGAKAQVQGNSEGNYVIQAAISSILNPTQNPPTWVKESCVSLKGA